MSRFHAGCRFGAATGSVASSALRFILGLPDGAYVEAVRQTERADIVEFRVAGFGPECAEGALIERGHVIVNTKTFDGERWHQSAAKVSTS